MTQKVPTENLGLRVIGKAVSSSLSTKEKGEKDSSDFQDVYQSLSQGEKILLEDGVRSKEGAVTSQ